MAYSNKAGALLTGTSLGANLTGDTFEVSNQSCGAISVAWSGASAVTAVLKVQESVDGINFKDMSGKTVTIGAASGADLIKLNQDEMLSPFIRVVLTKNTETTGTFTARYFFKGL